MKKLVLELNDLHVESFPTDEVHDVRGTVAGQNELYPTVSCNGSCVNTCASCMNTCLNTCPYSCWGTCVTGDTCDSPCTQHYSVCPPPPLD